MDFTNWQHTGSYFNYTKQHKVFYQKAGNGETIVLLHGFPTASWDWWKIWDKLTQNYQVIALDFLGFGFSDKPKKHHYSILEQVDIVEALVSSENIKNAHILAHDYGDTVAQELLARCNEGNLTFNISSLSLLNGGLFPETHHPRFIQKALLSPVGFLLTPLLSKNSLRKNFKSIFGKETQPTEQEITEFYQLINYNSGKYIFHLLIRYMNERVEHRTRWVSALQETKIPIQLINGNADPISGKHMVERYKELVATKHIVSFQEIGHYPQTEAPKLVQKAYLSFLDEFKTD